MLFFSSIEASIAANWVKESAGEKPRKRASPSFFILDDIWLAFEAADYDSRQTLYRA